MAYSNYRDREWPFVITYAIDLARYRHLLWNLVGSDLRGRFRRSRLGILWGMIQPMSFAVMLAIVWGTVFKSPDPINFMILIFSGIIAWEYLTTSIMGGLDALMSAGGYVKQSRIPFVIFQARVPLTATVMFLFGLLGLVIVMAVTQRLPPLSLAYLQLPIFLVLMLVIMLPLTIIFSVLGTKFRDTKYIIGILIQAMFFLTPVMLPRETLDQPHLHWLVYANPAVSVLDMLRDAIVYGKIWSVQTLAIFGAWTAALWALAILLSAQFGRRIVFAI
jgi:lipopolysaccharide transport system permease protein